MKARECYVLFLLWRLAGVNKGVRACVLPALWKINGAAHARPVPGLGKISGLLPQARLCAGCGTSASSDTRLPLSRFSVILAYSAALGSCVTITIVFPCSRFSCCNRLNTSLADC